MGVGVHLRWSATLVALVAVEVNPHPGPHNPCCAGPRLLRPHLVDTGVGKQCLHHMESYEAGGTRYQNCAKHRRPIAQRARGAPRF